MNKEFYEQRIYEAQNHIDALQHLNSILERENTNLRRELESLLAFSSEDKNVVQVSVSESLLEKINLKSTDIMKLRLTL